MGESYFMYLESIVNHLQFQTVIPELVPGTAGEAPWMMSSRALLWGEEQWAVHTRIGKLQQPSPSKAPLDTYKLRNYWPAVVEALRPMPPPLLAAANRVYRIVARVDCLSGMYAPDGGWLTYGPR